MEQAVDTLSTGRNLSILCDAGTGRLFTVLFDDETYRAYAVGVAEALQAKGRTLLIDTSCVTRDNWSVLAYELETILNERSVRQSTIVAFGAACALAQNLVLDDPRRVRTIILVDCTARPHPTYMDGIVDWIEDILPLGLPLRLGHRGFDVRAHLHRLRCPMLVATTRRATPFVETQSRSIATHAPTAWWIKLSSPTVENTVVKNTVENEVAMLASLAVEFQDVPAKCPQKNKQQN